MMPQEFNRLIELVVNFFTSNVFVLLTGGAFSEGLRKVISLLFGLYIKKKGHINAVLRKDIITLSEKAEKLMENAVNYYTMPEDKELARKIRGDLSSFAMDWNIITANLERECNIKFLDVQVLIKFRQALTLELDTNRKFDYAQNDEILRRIQKSFFSIKMKLKNIEFSLP